VTTQTEPLFAGRYELGQLLGGGTADVYLGTDTKLRRPVVIKIARTGAEIDDADRFENEMRLLAGMHDPGLVTLYDAGTVDGRPYLVMQYVPGGTLGERLHREGALDPDEVSRIGQALAGALGYLHEHQVIHRDIKPGNVLIDGEGKVHLADFGIARTVDSARVTATGLVIGTPAYLSPEQARGEPVTPASDLYALGLVLLECLTGRREYVGAPLEVAIARLHRPPSIPQDLPAPWPRLLAGLTAEEPTVRPSPRVVADILAGRATMPLPISPAAPQHDWAAPPTRRAASGQRGSRPRRRRGVIAGVATCVLAAGAAGAVILTGAWPDNAGAPGAGPDSGQSTAPARPGPASKPAQPVATQQGAQRQDGNSGPGSANSGRGRGGNSGAGKPHGTPGNGGPGATHPAPPATSAPAQPTNPGTDPTTDPPTSTAPADPPPTTDPGVPPNGTNPTPSDGGTGA
jgi:eukaryotic-like serine/threonine-protein kinase